ncbi:hypothetical protein [Paenibacillus sp. cl141a]|uniref:hypothetical protein n=1 Tax=Paenibacillus sp. cl141a TaxID=1761877 RepID=UPI0015870137|nr:hypothetical protein [Paenibacillus sp. cl141a]
MKIGNLQFYNADNDDHIGGDKIKMLMNSNEISNFEANADKVIWCSYIHYILLDDDKEMRA